MATVERSIDVEAPAGAVYKLWFSFDAFPSFLEGVIEVRSLDGRRLVWRTAHDGMVEEWEAEIVAWLPERRIAWRNSSEVGYAGAVTLEALSPSRTRVRYQVTEGPRPATAAAGGGATALLLRIEGDLARFKQAVEDAGRSLVPSGGQRTHAARPSAVFSASGEDVAGALQAVLAAPPPIQASRPRRASPPAASTVRSDATRKTYALLACPERVIAGALFTLTAGASPTPVPGVTGEAFPQPDPSGGAYMLTVQIVADGFRLAEGESWRQMLAVTVEQPYPSVSLHLIAEAQGEHDRYGRIRAIFEIGGQTVGFAERSVVVAASAASDPQLPAPSMAATADIVPTNATVADLTIEIFIEEGESEGRLLWTVRTPHEGIALPSEPLVTTIGKNPELFAKELVDKVKVRDEKPLFDLFLKGKGREIADQMPAEVLRVLREVAGRTEGRPPLVLILSEEPYIPWELAAVEPPLQPDPTKVAPPPFLAAQANVGRWILGQQKPKLPPPEVVEVSSIAVVSGVYERPGWRRLLEAEDEAQRLQASYGAVPVTATTEFVGQCIQGVPRAELLHFAVHGIYDPDGIQNGLMLVDGVTLDPAVVKGVDLEHAPFVFLNACQVGSGNAILGDYAGMAEAFLYAGAAAVVAPLWNINDATAKAIALEFYEQVFADPPACPADVFRRERAKFKRADGTSSGTYLAYQFFGHPAMKLSRRAPQQEGAT